MQVRHAFELPMLALLRHRPHIHLPAAQQLLSLCQNQMAQETFPGWMTFWSLAAHYFSGLCQARANFVEQSKKFSKAFQSDNWHPL
jgi:hypothetical protein